MNKLELDGTLWNVMVDFLAVDTDEPEPIMTQNSILLLSILLLHYLT